MNDNPLKYCPFCGKVEPLTIFKDPHSPVRVVICDPPAGGCGSMAPFETWNQRRAGPVTLYIVPNPPTRVQEAPDPVENDA